MSHAKRILLTSVAVLVLASTQAQAQPGDNRGQGQGQGKGQEQREAPAQPGRGQGEPGRGASEGNDWRGEGRDESRAVADGPRFDEREIRRLLIERRDWIEIDRGAESLPPGVRMNLERGKPLPPGIAMQLDERLLRDLPHYDGYEWRRVGPDVVLVDAANAIVYEILRDIFY
ncbi:hypothetical protein HOP62_02535 [Halomonas sp. MCCC 1A17488]|uniref:anti-virulence regulator CigR family protein n=1 Tax=unclassified Halomonas TaxID=2609666 RepID=UPI0018D20503|nr:MULTISPECIES: anti-virulence regulator CigR family protein [unclassified Halomonas]MCE8014951.1 hypothetical protein [Halomonas sp. MCCC 1A17488]MCG3238284.1 hypothetical protein [Halomonas sp. MCCC 1A17488]QPP47959.1 hypothetical protein I4484_11865 [Halomonas sp. SS10-MC5]